MSLAAAVFLSFVIFPPHRVAVQADGGQAMIVSRETDAAQVMQIVGVRVEQGDVVVRAHNSLTIERANPVLVAVDGNVMAWRTRAPTVQGLLDEVDVAVGSRDAVMINGLEVGVHETLYAVGVTPIDVPVTANASVANVVAPPPPPIDVTVRRAVPVRIVEDGKAVTIESSRLTVREALDQAGVTLGKADIVEPPLAAAVTPGISIDVRHARAVTIRIGSSADTIYTHEKTLREALAAAGYGLGAEDRVEPGLDTAVTSGMSARLVRVQGRSFVEKTTVDYKTVFKPDEGLSGSSTRLVKGHEGVRVREYRITIEDGVERERKLVEERMEPEVQDTVIYYAAASLRSSGLATDTFKVADTHHMWATWYNAASSGKEANDRAYGITFSGAPLAKGIVAVDPRVIPLGTRLYVPGYGFAIAGDTGGGIIGNMIDLGYPDGVAVDWRTGWVDVYILVQ